MTIIRVQKNRDNPFVQIDKRIFEDVALSWRAKGLLGYLLSRPDSWQILVADLVKRSSDGRDSCYAALTELGKAGYIVRTEQREKGRLVSRGYLVFESPQPTLSGEAVSGLASSGDARSGSASSSDARSGSDDTINTDVIKTETSTNTDLKEKAQAPDGAAADAASPAEEPTPQKAQEQTPTPTPSQADVQKDSSSQVAETPSTPTATASKNSRRGAAAGAEPKEPKFDAYKVELPDYVPHDLWISWLDVRKAKRVPNTDQAIKLTLGGLAKARENGWDVRELLEEAVMRGWTACVFKEQRTSSLKAQPSRQGYVRSSTRDAILSEEVAESREETRARLEQEVRREAARYKRRGEE